MANSVLKRYINGEWVPVVVGAKGDPGDPGIQDIVSDTTPQLGGNLDVQSNSITTSVTNGNITLTPNGTGGVVVSTGNLTVNNGNLSAPAIVNTTTTALSGLGNQFVFGQAHSTAEANNILIGRSRGTNWSTGQTAVQSGDEIIDFIISGNDGSAANATGLKQAYGFTTVVTSAPSTGYIPSRTDWVVNTSSGVLTTYHQIGVDAIARFKEIGVVSGQTDLQLSAGTNGNLVLAPNGTGKTSASRLNYNEAIHSLGTTSGTITPDAANGNVQTITLNGNLTFSAFSNPVAGQSITLIINTNGTNRTLTSTMKFAGGEKTLSTTSTTDIISVFYDGTNYWASLGKDFK